MNENRVFFGIKNVHYAVATADASGDLTYGTPVPFPGATALTLDFRGGLEDFYADDRVYYTSSTHSGYDGTLTVANLLQQFRIDVLGDTIDSDGIITENVNNRTQRIALMFEFNGDAHATRHVIYNVTLTRPGMSSETTTDTTTPQTQDLTFVAAPDNTGLVKRSTSSTTPTAVYNAWYTTVFVPTPPTP